MVEAFGMTEAHSPYFFPVVVLAEFDSPIDALLELCVPMDEAMDLVAAVWGREDMSCVLATIDGGRQVAAVRTPEGRWAACNAFPEKGGRVGEAERQLGKLLRRGRRGYVVQADKALPGAH